MIVQFVLLKLLHLLTAVFESARYWCDAVLVPLCYLLISPKMCLQKPPKHVAVIVKRDSYAEKTAQVLHDLNILDYTLIVDDSKNHIQLSNHLYVKGSYPRNMLKESSPPPKEYDLVISFQDHLDLHGVDARCIGFATFAVVPCVCSFFVKMQLCRAMAIFAESRQNYGK